MSSESPDRAVLAAFATRGSSSSDRAAASSSCVRLSDLLPASSRRSAPLDELDDEPFDEVEAHVRARLGEILSRETAVIADDSETLDSLTNSMLSEVRSRGSIVRVLQTGSELAAAKREPDPDGSAVTIALAPLEETALRPLFAGPDRIFHRPRGRRSQPLWLRTGGLPARIADQVAEWLQGGVVRWHDADPSKLTIDREMLERLATEPVNLAIAAQGARGGDTRPSRRDLRLDRVRVSARRNRALDPSHESPALARRSCGR